MSFMDGLKAIWSDPEIRKKAIGYTAVAVLGTSAVAYGVTKATTKKSRRREEEYLNEPDVISVNGELYEQMPDGTLVPYWRNHPTD